MRATITALCAWCHAVITFVPGMAPTAEGDGRKRSEICEDCAKKANRFRSDGGLSEITVPEGAYGEVLTC
jgi:hypothetical protein